MKYTKKSIIMERIKAYRTLMENTRDHEGNDTCATKTVTDAMQQLDAKSKLILLKEKFDEKAGK